MLSQLILLAVAAGSDAAQDGIMFGSSQASYPYSAWGPHIRAGTCGSDGAPLHIDLLLGKEDSHRAVITCALEDGVKAYRFPAGIFELDVQLLVPDHTSITGAKGPNDMADPTKSPVWEEQTLFLATRGATDYDMNYCHAPDMVTTRVGFVLSSHVTVQNVSYQGIDTIRPKDNGALCGGGAFETKGCAENDCQASGVNNGGSDGIGSTHVTISNVRLNDFYYPQDQSKVGLDIEGNTDCSTNEWDAQCCFCKPNGIRSSQVGIWVPQTRNVEGTQKLRVNNVVSMTNQADGINLHGYVRDALVQNAHFENTGDDIFVLWGAQSSPENVTFKDCVAVNPGILRPNWYGNCVATYGLKSVVFDGLTCRAPALDAPILSPDDQSIRMDMSMFIFFTSFGAGYPEGNLITIKGWTFEDLQGQPHTPSSGTFGHPKPGKMVWTRSKDGDVAPYYFPDKEQKVNVLVIPSPAENAEIVYDLFT